MLQNLSKGKMVEWVVLLVALVALGLSIAAVAKPCKSDFADRIQMSPPNGPVLPGTAEYTPGGQNACRNDMACRGGQSYVCPPGTSCRQGSCEKSIKEKTFICDDGGGNPGQQPECCNLDSGCSSTAHGGDLQCLPDSRCSPGSGYSCQPGGHSPLKCTKMGNPCRDTDDPPCCPGLTCNAANECVKDNLSPDLGNIGNDPRTYTPSPSPSPSPSHVPACNVRGGNGVCTSPINPQGKRNCVGGENLCGVNLEAHRLVHPQESTCESLNQYLDKMIHCNNDYEAYIDGNVSLNQGNCLFKCKKNEHRKSSDLPLILGITGSVGLVIVLAIAYLIVTKRLKL